MPSSELVARITALSTQFVDPIAELAAEIAAVPAPTNDEAERARFVAGRLTALGHVDVEIDRLSDVVGRLRGKDSSRALLLAAHIDTVFPRDTPVAVSRDGDVLAAPGIGDNSISVAAVALVGKALEQLDHDLAVD
ncbi:MAG: M28 family peptidase, partial [Chloroflexota bacterium]|nr:M28 family peptidase [Chloroflexota bacterium]